MRIAWEALLARQPGFADGPGKATLQALVERRLKGRSASTQSTAAGKAIFETGESGFIMCKVSGCLVCENGLVIEKVFIHAFVNGIEAERISGKIQTCGVESVGGGVMLPVEGSCCQPFFWVEGVWLTQLLLKALSASLHGTRVLPSSQQQLAKSQ